MKTLLKIQRTDPFFTPPQRPKQKTEHGGSFAIKKRRAKRPLNPKNAHHLVLRSELARGERSLFKNKALAMRILVKYAKKFNIRIYGKCINTNHIHLHVKGRTKEDLQNFFRVFSGQVAQELLLKYPLQKHESPPSPGGTHPKNKRSFWSTLIYSKIISWGREYQNVQSYIIRNIRESLGLIPYTERRRTGALKPKAKKRQKDGG